MPKLSREERQQIRIWLDSEEFAESDALLAAVEDGFRALEQGPMVSLEEARETVRRCATRSADQFRKSSSSIAFFTQLDAMGGEHAQVERLPAEPPVQLGFDRPAVAEETSLTSASHRWPDSITS